MILWRGSRQGGARIVDDSHARGFEILAIPNGIVVGVVVWWIGQQRCCEGALTPQRGPSCLNGATLRCCSAKATHRGAKVSGPACRALRSSRRPSA